MMRLSLRWAGAFLGLVFVLPVLGADEKPEKPEKTEKDKKDSVSKMVGAGQLAGKVVSWDSQDFLLTLSVKLQVTDGLDEGAANAMAQAERDIVAAAYEKDPRTRLQKIANAQKSYVENSAKLIKYKTIDQQIEIHVADDVKVRLLNLPIQFDDKGFPVSRTKDEVKELKGSDPKLPGFKGTAEDIKNEAIVIVVLSKKKKEVEPKEKDPKEPKEPVKEPKDKPTTPRAQPGPDDPIKLGRAIQATLIVVGSVPDNKENK